MSAAANATSTASSQDPGFITPLEVTFPLGGPGDDITVRPATVGQIARLMGVVAPLVDSLFGLDAELLERLQSAQGPTAQDVTALFELLSEHPARLLEMVAIASDLPQGEVEALLPDQFAYLFAVCVQVNADFFSRAIPVFKAAGARIETAKAKAAPAAQLKPARPGRAASTR